MKTNKFNFRLQHIALILVFVSLSVMAQEPFNCPYWDFYNRDTAMLYKRDSMYDSQKKEQVYALMRAQKEDRNNSGIQLETVNVPRCKVRTNDLDMKRIEELMLRGIEWMFVTPVDMYTEQRKEVHDYIQCSNCAMVKENDKIMAKLKEKDPQNENLLSYYRMGIMKYITINVYEPDDVKIQLAGLLAVNELYKANPSIRKNMPDILVSYGKNKDEKVLMDWIKGF